MKKFSKKTYFLTGIIAIAAMFIYQSCTFNVSTASISAAELVKIVPGGQSVKVGTTFHPNDGPFHLFVVVANGPADTKVKASWYGMEADGKSVLIDENEVSLGENSEIDFSLSLPRPWPVGTYKVDLKLNGVYDRSITSFVRQ